MADDDAAIRALFATVLGRAGFDVVQARDGLETLEQVKANEVGLILLDSAMPGMDGLAVIRSIRADPATASIPIIMVTGATDETDRVRGLDHGADDYLAKPTSLPELVARVRANVRSYETWRDASSSTVRAMARSLAAAQRIAHVGSWDRDLTNDFVSWSDESCRIFGVEPGSLDGPMTAYLERVHPDDRTRVAPDVAALLEQPERSTDYRILRADGEVRDVNQLGSTVFDGHGRPERYVGSIQDVTDRRRRDLAMRRMVAAIEQTADSVLVENVDGTIEYVNQAFEQVYGYPAAEVIGRDSGLLRSDHHPPGFWSGLHQTVAAGGTWSGSIVNRRRDGSLVQVEASMSAIHGDDGKITSYMQVDRDVTRERELESELDRDARERGSIEAALGRIDPSATPEDIAREACAEISALPGVGSSWVIGLAAGRGWILATTGPTSPALAVGNPLSESPAHYLLDRAGAGPWVEDMTRRTEDDVFGAAVLASGVQTAVFAPLRGNHGVVGVIGFGGAGADPTDPLIQRFSQLATFGTVIGALLAPGLEARNRADDARESIQRVLDDGTFDPYFQPIVDLRSGAVVGYEALTRFRGGPAPDVVFAAAAGAGLGIELEEATLRAALAASVALPASSYLSLNLSPDAAASAEVAGEVRDRARPIVLEITEHIGIKDYPGLGQQLLAFGANIELAVDDAGAGYASMQHILELAPRYVKLDIGLICGIDSDPARQALVAGIGFFAQKRQISLIAEGVETAAELATLRTLGIDHGQGYLLGRPQDSRHTADWPDHIDVDALV